MVVYQATSRLWISVVFAVDCLQILSSSIAVVSPAQGNIVTIDSIYSLMNQPVCVGKEKTFPSQRMHRKNGWFTKLYSLLVKMVVILTSSSIEGGLMNTYSGFSCVFFMLCTPYI